MLWPPFTWVLLMYAILAGGCTGSTGGGIKSLRLLVLGKVIRNYFSRLIHPNAVIPVRINNQALPSDTVMGVLMFISLYLLCILVGWAVLCLLGIGFSDALGLVASSMGTPGLPLATSTRLLVERHARRGQVGPVVRHADRPSGDVVRAADVLSPFLEELTHTARQRVSDLERFPWQALRDRHNI